jgi:hypothetical protein
MRNTCRDLAENLKGGDHLEDLEINGRTVLEWTVYK